MQTPTNPKGDYNFSLGWRVLLVFVASLLFGEMRALSGPRLRSFTATATFVIYAALANPRGRVVCQSARWTLRRST
jgi:hypothetical protein